MEKHVIAPVSDNNDKQRTYRSNISRYNAAMKHEFYFEAMLIDYAIIEDRLSSILFHMGALANRTDSKICTKVRKQLKAIVGREQKEEVKLVVKKISGKAGIVGAVARWAAETAHQPEQDKYLQILKEQFLAVEGMSSALADLGKWCGYRNEIIHGLMNKNLESLNTELARRCDEGFRLARYFDAQVRVIKKGNRIRKCLKLKID
jgi:hypothetical protein